MIRGPRHKDILPEHEQIVNAGFHVIANGCGFINGLTILLAMPSQLIELLFVGAELQRTQSTYLFGAVCPERGAGAALVLPACNTEAMQLHLDEIATKVTPAHTLFSFSIKLDGTAPKTSRFPKTSRSCRCRRVRRAQPARKYLAIHAGELAVEPHLQILRRNRRSLLLRLEYAHRSTMENHVHRSPRLGSRRSLVVRVGINHFCSRSASRVQWSG